MWTHQEKREKSKEQRTKSKEQRAKSKEQKAKSKEQRAKRKEKREKIIKHCYYSILQNNKGKKTHFLTNFLI